jgi:hypothetical protein
MARKSKANADQFIKALDPRDADTKYMGDEPIFLSQPDENVRGVVLARSFAWYNRFYAKKDAKTLMLQYLDLSEQATIAKTIKTLPESEYIMTYCWLARMTLRGLELNEKENQTLTNEINRLVTAVTAPEAKVSATAGAAKDEVKVEAVRPNIQEIMREKAREAAGELEGLFDDFVLNDSKATTKMKPMDEVAKKNVMPQHISLIADIWKKKQAEFTELQDGKDKVLNEAYAHLSKIQVRNTLKFIEGVLGDLNSYISVKKATKAPRARKAVPVEKIVSKLKYLKTFKDDATKVDLTSVHPTKLHGSSEAWTYDTTKRKVTHWVADEYSKTFTVKGNTILGFDTVKSETKTLRKPAEQLKEIMGSKPAARKFFNDIKAVATTPNGRFNENIIILKAW